MTAKSRLAALDAQANGGPLQLPRQDAVLKRLIDPGPFKSNRDVALRAELKGRRSIPLENAVTWLIYGSLRLGKPITHELNKS